MARRSELCYERRAFRRGDHHDRRRKLRRGFFARAATKNGLVPVVVSAELGRKLLDAVQADPTLEFTIDVDRCLLEVPALGIAEPFPLDDATRERFLQGLDDIGLSLAYETEIGAFESNRPVWMPATA